MPSPFSKANRESTLHHVAGRRGGSVKAPVAPHAPAAVTYTAMEEGLPGSVAVAPAAAEPAVVGNMADAVKRTALAVGAAFAFGAGLWFVKGRTSAMEFMAGYLIEQSLSVDNVFVFLMLFDYFKVSAVFPPDPAAVS